MPRHRNIKAYEKSEEWSLIKLEHECTWGNDVNSLIKFKFKFGTKLKGSKVSCMHIKQNWT